MDMLATAIGGFVLIWMFVGPLIGYTVRDRGWRFRSPFTRNAEDDE